MGASLSGCCLREGCLSGFTRICNLRASPPVDVFGSNDLWAMNFRLI